MQTPPRGEPSSAAATQISFHGESSSATVPPLAYFKQRLDDKARFVPVLAVWCTLVGLDLIYFALHCAPLLQDRRTYATGVAQTATFSAVNFLLVYCLAKTILVHPGTLPGDDLRWEYIPYKQHLETAPLEPRHCKWCNKLQPDRTEHCRTCRACILRKDHHCPWVYNCIGFRNHKYFVLMLFYAFAGCSIMTWTMITSLKDLHDPETPFPRMFFLLFGESLAALIGAFVAGFLGFQVFLISKGVTTVEFCRRQRRSGGARAPGGGTLLGNLQAVLGENPLLWIFPVSPPTDTRFKFLPKTLRPFPGEH